VPLSNKIIIVPQIIGTSEVAISKYKPRCVPGAQFGSEMVNTIYYMSVMKTSTQARKFKAKADTPSLTQPFVLSYHGSLGAAHGVVPHTICATTIPHSQHNELRSSE